MNKSPTLYLIPSPLSEDGFFNYDALGKMMAHVRTFLVEEPKTARRVLKRLNPPLALEECKFLPLSEHTRPPEFENYLAESAGDIGIISGAGCPCVADPGAEIVLLAHQKGWKVIPLIGPSSILLALMASGFNGQNFAFNGYLPRERSERVKKICELEQRSFQENQTQVFMETPYRNQELLKDILACAQGHTLLSLAVDLTAPGQWIKTMSVTQWQKEKIDIHKKLAIFQIYKKNIKERSGR